MPCLDGGETHWDRGRTLSDDERNRSARATRAIRNLSATLCLLLSAYGEDFLLNNITDDQWAESGVTREQVKSWWADHQQKDLERKRREAAAEVRRQAKVSGLAKLTDAEKAALGLLK